MQDFIDASELESMYRAYKKARCGKRWKQAAINFEINAMEAVLLLGEQLRKGTYTLSEYNVFKVYEPKERIVMSNSYKDKVVQHALCDNILEPTLSKTFIYDNYASQIGKGTKLGLERMSKFMRKHFAINKSADGWVLKCDVRKYFYNINHTILKEKLRKYFSCSKTLNLLDMIIDSTEGNIGIPIGNQSSQLFALLYLSDLDHFIKEKLGIKFYGRYMDDFYLIHKDKEYLKYCLTEITKEVSRLGLELNSKTCISPLKNGIDFLGFHTYLTDSGKVISKLRRSSKSKMRRRLKKFYVLNKQGKLPIERIECSYQSWKGHAKRGNCYHLIRKMDKLYYSLFKKEEKQ